jgi:uncharacterized NAD(P)/FAD-binding protein YdhS
VRGGLHLQVDVAIVGAGFSGTALTVQLLRRAKCDVSIALIDRADRVARGVAYSATHKDQMLNVAAGKMSALADEPDHFLHWLANAHRLENVAQAFLPRHLYGEYLAETLNEATCESNHAGLRRVAGHGSSLSAYGERIRVECSSGEAILAKFVVLATGNYPPPDPPEMKAAQPHRYIRYPWAPDALDGIGAADAVLILGSGLTAVDQIFTLKNRGFHGTIHVISSRGLLPRGHETPVPWPCDWETIGAGSMSLLMGEVRRQIASAAEAGIGWRAVVDSLRRSSQNIWKSLSLAERRRFLRHVRPFWDVHRHRVSPEVHQALHELGREDRLIVWAGRCLSVIEEGNWATVLFRPRGKSEAQAIRVHQIINCTGPNTIKRLADDPLIDSIFHSGLGRPDPIGMGLDTGEFGGLIDAAGKPDKRLFAIGPLRKGTLWETTAVPEIRVQALDLADHILAFLAALPAPLRGESPITESPIPESPILDPPIVEPSIMEGGTGNA